MLIDFRERRREREGRRDRQTEIDVRNINQLPFVCTPTRDPTHNLGMCPDRESNPQTFGVKDNTPTN